MRRSKLSGILRVDGCAISQQSSLKSFGFDDALSLAAVLGNFFADVLLLYGTVVASFAHAKTDAAETLGVVLVGRNATGTQPGEYIVEDSALMDLTCFEAIVDGLISFRYLLEDIFDDGIGLFRPLEVLPVNGITIVVELQCASVFHGLLGYAQTVLDRALAHF